MAIGFGSIQRRGRSAGLYIQCKTNDEDAYTIRNESDRDEVVAGPFKDYSEAHDKLDELQTQALRDRIKNSKRTRAVFPSAEIPHLWIHEVQDSGRNGNGHLFFNGPVIYSYGVHFPIARIIQNKRKSKAVLFNTARYSNTTSGHQSCVRSAIPKSIPVFDVPDLEPTGRVAGIELPDHSSNLKDYTDRVTGLMGKMARARSAFQRDYLVSTAIPEMRLEAERYAEFFGISRKLKLPKLPDNWDDYGRQVRSDAAKEIAEKKRKDAERHAKYMEEIKEACEQWRAGLIPIVPSGAPTMLRIISTERDGLQVQTSRGVRVPVDHARRALRFVRRVMREGQEYRTNGHTFYIGSYSVDRIETSGTLHAGCHVIEWAEIERIAPELDKINTEVSQ